MMEGNDNASPGGRWLVRGSFLLARQTRRLSFGDKWMKLSKQQFEILWKIMRGEGETVTTEDIARHLIEAGDKPSGGSIGVQIREIRAKAEVALELDFHLYLHNVWGVGYYFSVEPKTPRGRKVGDRPQGLRKRIKHMVGAHATNMDPSTP